MPKRPLTAEPLAHKKFIKRRCGFDFMRGYIEERKIEEQKPHQTELAKLRLAARADALEKKGDDHWTKFLATFNREERHEAYASFSKAISRYTLKGFIAPLRLYIKCLDALATAYYDKNHRNDAYTLKVFIEENHLISKIGAASLPDDHKRHLIYLIGNYLNDAESTIFAPSSILFPPSQNRFSLPQIESQHYPAPPRRR